MSAAPRSRLAATLLSLVVPGLGQIYLGQRGRGIAFLVAAVVVPAIPALAAPELGRGMLLAMTAGSLLVAAAAMIDAVRFCKPAGAVPMKTVVGIGVAFYLVAPIVIAIALRILVVEAFKIPSGAMMPTLMVGDHLFADKIVYRKRAPTRGEQMIFAYPEHPNQDFVKRVVAVGGDKIEARGGHPIINGWEVPSCAAGKWTYTEEDSNEKRKGDLFVEFLDGHAYLTFYDSGALSSDYQGPFHVKPGEFFVMGDNRNNSHDSRMWWGGQGGGVPTANVRARPRWVWMSIAGRSGVDVESDAIVPPAGADAAAIKTCLANRPPREKTVPPGSHEADR